MHYYTKKHRGEKRLFLKTPNDKVITNKLKEIAPCRWSQTEKAWHFEATNEVFKKLREAFPDILPLETISNGNAKGDLVNAKPEKQIVKAVQYQPGRFRIIAFYNPLLVSIVKTFPYAKYDKANKWWSAAIDEKQKKALEDFCSTEGMALQWEDEQKKKALKPRPQVFEIPNYRACPDVMLQN